MYLANPSCVKFYELGKVESGKVELGKLEFDKTGLG